MKKAYIEPSVITVLLSSSDVIAVSLNVLDDNNNNGELGGVSQSWNS